MCNRNTILLPIGTYTYNIVRITSYSRIGFSSVPAHYGICQPFAIRNNSNGYYDVYVL